MRKLIASTLLGLLLCVGMYGQAFDSGSTGADGPFNPPSQVPAGTQVEGNCTMAPGCTVTVPLREPPNQVFNFTTVTISPFVTVKFRRNVANTPVFILARGDVTINGAIDVSGQNASDGGELLGGPGGYSGGFGGIAGSLTGIGGAGGGPGGGGGGDSPTSASGSDGGFGSQGFGPDAGAIYGSELLLPLIGGSGGGGGFRLFTTPLNGGGGGGALLIASSSTIDLGSGSSDAITAIGGRDGIDPRGGRGSGGAIRLMATTLRGSRRLDAFGGGNGRIRLEASMFQYTGSTNPTYIAAPPGPVFPPIMPTLRIVSIAGVPVPERPTSFVRAPDVNVPGDFTNPVTIELEARNAISGTRARVIVAPQFGDGRRAITQPVELTGPSGQPKRGTAMVTLPTRGVGIISAVIDLVVPEP